MNMREVMAKIDSLLFETEREKFRKYMIGRNEAIRLGDTTSPGEAEWVVAFVDEDGRAKACSSPSERSARDILAKHPEGTLYYGKCLLYSIK